MTTDYSELREASELARDVWAEVLELSKNEAEPPALQDAVARYAAASKRYEAWATPQNISALLDDLAASRAEGTRAQGLREAVREYKKTFGLTQAGWATELTRTGQPNLQQRREEMFQALAESGAHEEGI